MKQWIGDKKFYQNVLAITLPIIIQNGITNFVSLLDNIMVGQVGTEQMSGVAISNQLLFVFNLCIFGAVSGAGIFSTQFYGQGNHKGMREVFRFKLLINTIMVVLGIGIYGLFGEMLINQFLHDSGESGDLALALVHGKTYLYTMLVGLIPFAISQTYASTLRETGETVLPMKASAVAVIANLGLNYLLIFGKFGCPKLGAQGAAVATIVARCVECIIIVRWTHQHKEKNPYIVGVYQNYHISKALAIQIILKGTPLMLNEALWAGGMVMLNQCYSVKGLAVVAGLNIASTISNLFNVVYISLGHAIGIIVGQILGAGKMEEAKDTDTKLIFFSVFSCIGVGFLLALMAPLFPKLYKTTDEVKSLATQFIVISAMYMPIGAFMNAAYFTLRSGGKTVVTFLFDSVYVWLVSIPLAFYLTRVTAYPIVLIYLICQFVDIIKCVIGYILVKKNVWLHNIVIDTQ